jgi:hypothetical protein
MQLAELSQPNDGLEIPDNNRRQDRLWYAIKDTDEIQLNLWPALFT